MNDISAPLEQIEQLVLSYIHNLTSNDQIPDTKTVLLGHPTLADLIDTLKKLPKHELYATHQEILKNICLLRSPSDESRYFEFFAYSKYSFSYDSMWIGTDENNADIREPRPLNGKLRANRYRSQLNQPIYIIDTLHELIIWANLWLGRALIKEDMARDHFFELFMKKPFK